MKAPGGTKVSESRPALIAAISAPANSGLSAQDKRWLVLGVVVLIVGIALRLQLATASQTPGHGDSAFYYTVAKNIVDGRGLVVDYVVYFFAGLVPITHYAGDFWNPLAEILLSLPMMLLGKSVFNALLATASINDAIEYHRRRRLLCRTPVCRVGARGCDGRDADFLCAVPGVDVHAHGSHHLFWGIWLAGSPVCH